MYICYIEITIKIMKTKIQIKSIFGNVLFELETENNSIKKTLEQAVKESADLRDADLRYADLSYADLRYADLRDADLSDADLRYADLRDADLRDADLSDADLRYADLSSADLRYADLRYAKNKETSYLPIYCKWSYSIKGDKIQIGCKEKTIEEWDLWFKSNEIYSTERNTEEFKQIEAVYNALKAYYLTLNS